jgi:UDP-2,4-diacetamido-2,4,6-trideoxy-beta-L-altropyranose hydrolase
MDASEFVQNHMRKATLADSRKVFDIRNKPEIRSVSTKPDPLNFDEHNRWFSASLENPSRDLFVLERDGEIYGVLRYDIEGSEAEVSIYLDPRYWRQGLGKAMLEYGENHINKTRLGTNELKAIILKENANSLGLFKKAGFEAQADGSYVKSLVYMEGGVPEGNVDIAAALQLSTCEIKRY